MRIQYVSEWDEEVFDNEEDCRIHEEKHEKAFHNLPAMLDGSFKRLPTFSYKEIERTLEECWYVVVRNEDELEAFNHAVDFFGIGTNIKEVGIFFYDYSTTRWNNLEKELKEKQKVMKKIMEGVGYEG